MQVLGAILRGKPECVDLSVLCERCAPHLSTLTHKDSSFYLSKPVSPVAYTLYLIDLGHLGRTYRVMPYCEQLVKSYKENFFGGLFLGLL